ncbi:MAG: mevalonate kinase [Deltaproteobacteria bacterium]|nr:mevalonate kinase [Deltaproteobacteria bacterium]NNK08822.1 mevalonate kinase [Myxococcales bacterium]
MGFGRGKVILLGEHAVVHGCPAIAVGIERGVTAEATMAERNTLDLSPWGLSLEPDPLGREPLERAFAAALSLYPERPALQVSADVELPAGAGLGCSAAIGVAVLDAIDEALGIERSRAELAEAALVWERVFHGNPSGIDNAMSAIGGVALYRKGEPLQPLRPNKPLHLAIGYSGESSSTKEMVASVARQLADDPRRVNEAFEAIEVLVRNARLAIEAGDHISLGQLLDLNHSILCSLMLCTSRLDEMCRTARSAGALGAKMTGAGGGGCMFALAPKHDLAVQLCEVLGPEAFAAEVSG